jgi:hypothetical protein
VVYEWTIDNLKTISLADEIYQNSFAEYLRKKQDKEAITLLILAKRCEQARAQRADKWWYPTKEDLKNYDLQAILNEALAYKGKKLKARYLLQAVRAAYTMQKYDLCLKLWNTQIKHQPTSAVKMMSEGYIGGIYFKRDITIKVKSDMERIKILYQYQPSSPELAVMVQKICREAEENANRKVFDGVTDTEEYKKFLKNRKRYLELRDFALQVVEENRTNNPAMWQYAAAFLTFLDGDCPLSTQYLAKAGQMKGTSLIKNSIKIFQIMIDAYTSSYDADFEARILPQLQWLDKMICTHITDEVKEEYDDNSTFSNYSQYYYGDMMRKITLSVMLPKYLEQNEGAKALLLAGMASERLRSLAQVRQNRDKDAWNIDFRTNVFDWMNRVSIENVIAYKQKLLSGTNTAFEQFLASRCYKNKDYLNEIIGTKYMRLEKFDKAVQYLSRVSPNYAKTLNVYQYFHYDPFAEPYLKRTHSEPYPNYKLDFATQMLKLQGQMQTARNRESKMDATFQYAWGLKRAASDCWALIGYETSYNYEFAWGKPMMRRAETLMKTVVASSASRNLKAKCAVASAWLIDDNKNYNLLRSKYASSDVFEQFYSECDRFTLYCKKVPM